MQNGIKSDQSELGEYSFLQDRRSGKIFAKLDYRLRCGEHFQFKHPEQNLYWEYLVQHEADLTRWYEDVYQVVLVCNGVDFDRYFYIDFDRSQNEIISSNILSKYRQELSFDFVLVGFILWKFIYIDCEVELTSKHNFFNLIALSSDHTFKSAAYKIFAHSRGENYTDFDDDKVLKLINNAFSEFNKLGWIVLFDDNDSFEIMGSFHRLVELYRTEIEKIFCQYECLNMEK